MSRQGREWGLFALLVAPNLALLAAFTYWPLLFNAYLSLTEWNMISPEKPFVGFENYRSLATDPTFWRIFGNTFYFVGGGVLATLAVALAAALLLNQKLYGRGFARGVAFAPTVMTGSAIAIVWNLRLRPELRAAARLPRRARGRLAAPATATRRAIASASTASPNGTVA